MKKIFILLILIILTGCTNSNQPIKNTYEPNVGAQCNQDQDCQTPFEYAIQSNCPFSSACIENQCRVVCPLFYHDPNPEVSKSYQNTCQSDSDCNCSERGNKSLNCKCLNEKCLSIEG